MFASLAACDGPQSTLQPSGPSAHAIALLWWGMFAASALVLVVVVGLWLYALMRPTPGMEPGRARTVTNRWIIGGGILLPSSSVFVLLLFGIPAGYRMLPLPLEGEQPLVIEVTGHRWWWEVRYPEAGVRTANQLFLPVGRPVDIQVTSADVIHSFWVPRLGGKLDMLPGRTNVLRLEADETGRFRAQCAEFCGRGHAHMAMIVEALAPGEFDAWLKARQQPVIVDSQSQAVANAFGEICGDCHRVNGISEGGGAPDLSTVGARALLGGRPRAVEEGIDRWLQTHATLKLGAPVPDHRSMAPEQQLRDIATWLETLGHE